MNRKERFLLFLFILAISLAAIDMELSYIADMTGGYYETNSFTAKYGLIPHFVILLVILSISYVFFPYKAAVAFLAFFDVVWTVNNIISYYYLL